MPDGTPGSESPQTPAAPTVPEGMTLVPKDQLETLQRQANNYKGAAPLLNAAVELGFKTPDDLKSAFEPVRQAREMKVDLGGVLTSLRSPEAQPEPKSDAERIKADILGEFRTEQARERHVTMQEHESTMVSNLVSKMAGDKADQDTLEAIEGIVTLQLYKSTPLYESGPLKGQPRPVNEREFSKIAERAQAIWASQRGQHLKDIAANAGTARSPAAPGGAGAGDGPARKPGQPPTRDEAREWLDRQRAARAGAPLSQA